MSTSITEGQTFKSGAYSAPIEFNPDTGAPLSKGQTVQTNQNFAPFVGDAIKSADTSTVTNTDTTAAPIPSQYTVNKGDTLSAIAAKNGTNVQAIQSANPSIKNPSKIAVGAKISLPGAPTGTNGDTTANKYQNSVLSKVATVPDQSNTAAVRNAAAGVTTPANTVEAAPTPVVQQSMQTMSNFYDPANLNQMINQAYNKQQQDLGIESGLDTQLMNVENIINGTGTDIRNEVAKAGGFISESQVAALTATRNVATINEANMLQQEIAHIQGDQSNAAQNQSYYQSILDKQQTNTDKMVTHTTSVFNSLVTKGGMAYALNIMSNGDPTAVSGIARTIGIDPSFANDPAKVAAADAASYKMQQLGLAQQHIYISEKNSNIAAAKTAAYINYMGASTSLKVIQGTGDAIKQLYPTGQDPIALYNGAQTMQDKVDGAYTQAIDPNNKSKGSAQLELLDAAVKLSNGGGQITEAQVAIVQKAAGIKSKLQVVGGQIVGLDTILSNQQMKAIRDLAHTTTKQLGVAANDAIPKINQYLSNKMGTPADMFKSPADVSAVTQNVPVTVNGKTYNQGQQLQVGGITLTYEGNGNFSGDDGNTYDSSGNIVGQ